MGQRRIYFQNGDILVATKGRRKNALKINKQYDKLPYKFTPYTKEEYEKWWKENKEN